MCCDFNCSKVIPKKCHADCCGPVPINKIDYQKLNQFKQRKIIKEHEINLNGRDFIIPYTEDLVCPYLGKDYKCAIYDHRPPICREFGNGKHSLLTCPYIEPNGKIRSKKNANKIKPKIDIAFRLS